MDADELTMKYLSEPNIKKTSRFISYYVKFRELPVWRIRVLSGSLFYLLDTLPRSRATRMQGSEPSPLDGSLFGLSLMAPLIWPTNQKKKLVCTASQRNKTSSVFYLWILLRRFAVPAFWVVTMKLSQAAGSLCSPAGSIKLARPRRKLQRNYAEATPADPRQRQWFQGSVVSAI